MAAVATMVAKEVRPQEPEPVAGSAVVLQGVQASTHNAMAHIEQHPEWDLLSRLPMRLMAGIPLPGFKVKDLIGLKPGQTMRSTWSSTDDVPLKIGAVLLSWSEFEVVEERMAIRLTRLG